MPKNPNVCILRTAGTNCDKETAFAFTRTGADVDFVHVNRLINREKKLSDYQILAIPGGFSYGDDVAAGRILANELRSKLIGDIKQFIAQGKLIIGICNGFQVLVKSGLLPGNDNLEQEASLIINDSGKFEDRWVYLKTPGHKDTRTPGKCIWTRGLPEVIYLPVAHGEGKFIVKNKAILKRLEDNNEVIFRYCDEAGNLSGYPDNPNGSLANIAGICDPTGRILGLMPHPERHIEVHQHPRWQNKKEGDGLRLWQKDAKPWPPGLQIFRNGVEYIKKHF